MADLSVMGFLDEDTQQETEYNLKDAQARSDISAINGKIPSAASSSNKLVDTTAMDDAIGQAVSAAYKPAGNKTVAELTSSLLVAANRGKVYNMTNAGLTTADFVEGAGNPIRVGDDVGICEPTTGTFKFNILSGFIAVDTNPTQSSANPVSSGGVYSEFAGIKDGQSVDSFGDVETALEDKVDKILGKGLSTNDYSNTEKAKVASAVQWTDAEKSVKKNLIKNIAITQTKANVVFTVNADKSISLANTSNAVTNITLVESKLGSEYKKLGSNLILSGGYSNTIYLSLRTTDWQTQYRSTGNELNIDTSTLGDDTEYTLSLVVDTNINTNGITIYPMIRKAGTPSGYVPYIPDNTELMTWEANTFLGTKNLISPTATKGGSQNNVSWVVNSDGSVTVNSSSASADCWIKLQDYVSLPNGTYIINGCPTGGAEGKYHLSFYIRKADDSGDEVGYKDYGEGAKFTLNYNHMRRMQVFIFVKNGQSIDNRTFYPMVRVVDDSDNTYRKYSATNQELTDGKIPWYVNESAGVKNLLPNAPKSDSTGGDNPVTFTVDNNGVVSISAGRVPTNGTNFELGRLLCKAKVGYRLTGMPNLNTADIKLRVGKLSSESDSGVGTLDDNASYDGGYSVSRTGYIFYNTDQWINISVNIAGGTTGTVISEALTFYPMVRYEEDIDDTYVSHAMTNKELTEIKECTISEITNSYVSFNTSSAFLLSRAGVKQLYMFVTVNTVSGTDDWVHFATLSEKPHLSFSGITVPWDSTLGSVRSMVYMIDTDGKVYIRAKAAVSTIISLTFI